MALMITPRQSSFDFACAKQSQNRRIFPNGANLSKVICSNLQIMKTMCRMARSPARQYGRAGVLN
jgi:hypothetical protein